MAEQLEDAQEGPPEVEVEEAVSLKDLEDFSKWVSPEGEILCPESFSVLRISLWFSIEDHVGSDKSG